MTNYTNHNPNCTHTHQVHNRWFTSLSTYYRQGVSIICNLVSLILIKGVARKQAFWNCGAWSLGYKKPLVADYNVDRFYFLSVRQLNAAVEDIKLSETIGIQHPQECLEYRLITKIIERIGAHAVRIAVNTQRLNSAVNPDNPIFKMAELSIYLFKSLIDSIA